MIEVYHIIPIHDTKEHVIEIDCWCCPEQDPEDPFTFIHNAIDGRNDYLDGFRKPH